MRSNPAIFITIFAVIILIIDLYTFYGINKIISDFGKTIKIAVRTIFWLVTAIVMGGFVYVVMFRTTLSSADFTASIHFVIGAFMLFYVPKLFFIIFNLLDDIIHITKKKIYKYRSRPKPKFKGKPMSRRNFLNISGLAVAAVPFTSLFYGIVKGRFNFTVRNVRLAFSNLPESFSGIKILQISDFHLGSFVTDPEQVEAAVSLINEQEADMVLFTGDLVNNIAAEVEPFMDILKSIKAPVGKFSILGNHDYGDYVRWNSPEEKKANLERLIELQQEAGFDVILDSHRQIKSGGESFDLVGVQNWGVPPFPQYGNLEKALSGTTKDSFKILMSHDPTHWDAQVRATDVDLTLSGHTHGAQFGIEIAGWRWSPVNLRYKQWGGLYREENQFIYVNTGLGFVGFPGRIGMPPEVTVFELTKI